MKKIYHLPKPHCKKARPIRQVDGRVYWKCEHES